MRRASCSVRRWLRYGAGLVSLLALHGAQAKETDAKPDEQRWCAPELDSVGEAGCYFLSPADDAQERTLVIFLHGLTGDGVTWQWDQQRQFARIAKMHHVSALMPRGRKGIGPGRDAHVWAWPNSKRAQAEVETSVLADITTARQKLEKRAGKFARTFVFGFSNGAYYATSLMLREKLAVDGYAAFAGGSGNKYDNLLADKVKRRVPMFVGYGKKDPDRKRQQDLVRLLKRLSWPHRALAANVGHTVTTEQLEGALKFLSGADAALSEPDSH